MWRQWFRRRETDSKVASPAESVQLTLSGWNDASRDGRLRVWRNSDGDILSLNTAAFAVPSTLTDGTVRMLARSIAQGRSGGLIEASIGECTLGRTAALIYKILMKPRYIYTGMLIVPRPLDPDLVWTVVSGEIGTTGVREAVITAELLNAG